MFTETDVAEVRHVVQRILVPCVFVIGLLGNSVSIYVLTRKRMRCTTNIYLTALAITDIIYLTMTMLLSLKHYDYVQRYCETYWMLYGTFTWLCDSCAYISIYIAVCFTIERFIAIRYPLKRQKFCTESLAKRVIAGVALFCLFSTISTAFEHQYAIKTKLIDSHGSSCNLTLANVQHMEHAELKPSTVLLDFMAVEGSGSSIEEDVVKDNIDAATLLTLKRNAPLLDMSTQRAMMTSSSATTTTTTTTTTQPMTETISATTHQKVERALNIPNISNEFRRNGNNDNNTEFSLAAFVNANVNDAATDADAAADAADTNELRDISSNDDDEHVDVVGGRLPLMLDALLQRQEEYMAATLDKDFDIFNITEYCQNVTYYANDFSSLAVNEQYKRIWSLITLFVFVLLPLAILATFNCFLIMLVRRSKNLRGEMTNASSIRRPKRKSNLSSVSQENRVTVTLIAVVLLFIISQLPWAIYLIVESYIRIEQNLQAIFGNILNFLTAINAAANFFLYCVLSDKYRKTVRELMTGSKYRANKRNALTNTSLYTQANGSRRSRPTSMSLVIK